MAQLDLQAEASLPVLGRVMRLRVYEYGRWENDLVVALENRRDGGTERPLVRIHSQCLTGDTLGSARCDCGPQLEASLAAIADAPWGILVYLPSHEGRGIGLVNKIRAYALQDEGLDTVEANVALSLPVDARRFDAAAAVLADLGVDGLRLLTNNPGKLEALRAAGMEVTRVPMPLYVTKHNRDYLATKKDAMGHVLPDIGTSRPDGRNRAGPSAALAASGRGAATVSPEGGS